MYRLLVASSIAFFTFLVIMGPLTYRTLIPALEYEAKNHLISVREIKKMQIQNFFYERYGDVHILSKNPIVEQSLPRFSNAFKSAGLDSAPYKQVDTYYGPLLEHYQRQYGYQNVLLVDKDGNVVFGVKRDEYLGTNLKTGVFSSFTIGEVYREGLNNIKFSDLTWSEDSKDFIFLGAAPVYDVSNNLLGLVVVEIPFSKIDYILLQRDGLGETGEIYVVGDDNFMRSKSRFLKQNTILKMEIDTQATKEALAGHTDIKTIKDYRNMPVLSAYTPLENLRDIHWVLLVEMDKKEAFYAVLALKTNLIIIGTVIAVITIVYLYFYFRKRHLQSGHARY